MSTATVSTRTNRRASAWAMARAFTLVELIATIVILGAIGSVASITLSSAVNSYVQAATQAQLHAELSIAMDNIDRQLRSTAPKSGVSGAPEVSSVTATSITWNTNYTLTFSGSTVTFAENGGAAANLLTDVTVFSVQAFDENNNTMAASLSGAACNSIRRLRIIATVQRSGISQTLRTKLFLRCTMEGGL